MSIKTPMTPFVKSASTAPSITMPDCSSGNLSNRSSNHANKPLEVAPSRLEGIGSIIRATRKASGLTLLEAAAYIGIAKQTLSDLERGRSSVGMHIVLKVLHDLGLGLVVAPKKELELVQRELAERPGLLSSKTR